MKIVSLALLFSLGLLACGSSGTTGSGGEQGTSGTTTPGTDPGNGSGTNTGQPGDGTGTGGDSSSSTQPGSYPIKHVVVIVKENHTFDNYFGTFPGAEGTTTCTKHDGTSFPCGHAPDRTTTDLCHAHSCALANWNSGKMNGWDLPGGSAESTDLAYAQYQESDIPNYWAYAKTFALGDHFFANVLGPSFPGHLFVLAAQCGWATGNPNTELTHPYWGCDQSSSSRIPIEDQSSCQSKDVFPCFKIPSVPDILPGAVNWKFYGTNFYVFPEIWTMFDAVDEIRHGATWSTNVVNASQFETDIDKHTLPNVTWLVNQDLSDEHPNIGSICAGENWTVTKINKLMKSDYWKDTAILFTMDDFGGWYDHVAPPRQYGCDKSHPYGLGFRLPLIILSPYAKPHSIFNEVSEQASIPKFIGKIFGAPKTLSDIDPAAQDGQANDLMGAFDFHQTPLPPLVLNTRTCL